MASDAAYHVRFAVQTLVVARGQLRRARGARAAGVVEARLEDTVRRLRTAALELAGADALQGAAELDVVALRRAFRGLEQCGEAVAGLQRAKGSRLLRAMVSTTSDRIARARALVELLARRAWGL